MEIRKILVFCVASASIALTACGDDNGNGNGGGGNQAPTEGEATAASIDGQWVSECMAVETIVGLSHEQRILVFSGNQLQRKLHFSDNSDCEDPDFIVEMTGTVKLQKSEDADEDENFGNIDIRLTGATAVGKTEAVVEKLNEFVYCGRGGWEVNERREITGEFTAGACPVLRVPDQRYGRYKVQEDKLHLSSYIDQMAEEENQRDQSLDVSFNRDSAD